MDKTPENPERGERIAKFLSRAGIASRRDAEAMIAGGKVRLNNTDVTHPAVFVQPGDLVVVDGRQRARTHPALALPQTRRAGDHP
jgi:23S rRNA pseudouridine2605 synthase